VNAAVIKFQFARHVFVIVLSAKSSLSPEIAEASASLTARRWVQLLQCLRGFLTMMTATIIVPESFSLMQDMVRDMVRFAPSINIDSQCAEQLNLKLVLRKSSV
jgi:hypothetical protein